jgi:hypothetical protein
LVTGCEVHNRNMSHQDENLVSQVHL